MEVGKKYFEELIDKMKEEKGVSLDVELTAEDLKTLAGQFKAEYKEKIGTDFPSDAKEQLMGAVKAAHMDKSLESLKHNFSKVRTGRANANILSDITVDYYGVPTPVTQVAAVKTPEAHMLLIEPWDKALINAIVKAIGASDLGITPNSDGTVVRLPFPAPTEERRRELVKECREYAEQAKVSIRNIRRDFNNKLERDEELTEDDVRREQAKVQKHTDEYVAKVEELLKEKEAEVMEI